MELGFSNLKAYRKIESFRIATGVVAILAAIYSVYSGLQYIGYIGYIGSIDDVAYILAALSSILKAAAMLMCAVFVFVFFGKKKTPIWGVAIIMMSVSVTVDLISVILNMMYHYRDFDLLFAIFIFPDVLRSVTFLLLALRYFEKIKINIKIFPMVALVTCFLQVLIPFLIFQNIYIDVFSQIFNCLPAVVFLLFFFFCPATHKRVNVNVSNSHLQEQEMIIGDLSTQLLYLKNEFESGKITQQDYDYKRKSLVDKL